MILVTQPFMPPKEHYEKYLEQIWASKWLTNQGPILNELESKLKAYLGVSRLQYVTNGTIALQLSIKALKLEGEVITTPFSFVATTNSIQWENCKPVFVDISSKTLCIDPKKIEKAITDKTTAILATHVYGIPCDVDKIQAIATKHNLKVIYDAAHAFGVRYKNQSVLSYGDISTLSFHATKLFHTVEGGAVIVNSQDGVDNVIASMKNFGLQNGIPGMEGINGKNSEFHAAMGLCNLTYIDEIIQERKRLSELYDSLLAENVLRPKIPTDCEYNYAYYPIIFEDEQCLLNAVKMLEQYEIYSRRYFYPSLNKLSYIKQKDSCEIAESVACRVLCLPLYVGLTDEQVHQICKLVKKAFNKGEK